MPVRSPADSESALKGKRPSQQRACGHETSRSGVPGMPVVRWRPAQHLAAESCVVVVGVTFDADGDQVAGLGAGGDVLYVGEAVDIGRLP